MHCLNFYIAHTLRRCGPAALPPYLQLPIGFLSRRLWYFLDEHAIPLAVSLCTTTFARSPTSNNAHSTIAAASTYTLSSCACDAATDQHRLCLPLSLHRRILKPFPHTSTQPILKPFLNHHPRSRLLTAILQHCHYRKSVLPHPHPTSITAIPNFRQFPITHHHFLLGPTTRRVATTAFLSLPTCHNHSGSFRASRQSNHLTTRTGPYINLPLSITTATTDTLPQPPSTPVGSTAPNAADPNQHTAPPAVEPLHHTRRHHRHHGRRQHHRRHHRGRSDRHSNRDSRHHTHTNSASHRDPSTSCTHSSPSRSRSRHQHLSLCDPTQILQTTTLPPHPNQLHLIPTPTIQVFAASSILGSLHLTSARSPRMNNLKFGWTIMPTNSTPPTNHNTHTLPASSWTAASPMLTCAITVNLPTSSGSKIQSATICSISTTSALLLLPKKLTTAFRHNP